MTMTKTDFTPRTPREMANCSTTLTYVTNNGNKDREVGTSKEVILNDAKVCCDQKR